MKLTIGYTAYHENFLVGLALFGLGLFLGIFIFA